MLVAHGQADADFVSPPKCHTMLALNVISAEERRKRFTLKKSTQRKQNIIKIEMDMGH